MLDHRADSEPGPGGPVRWVLIHGAWAGSWVWDRVAADLRSRGVSVVAPDLPGSGRWGDREITLSDVVNHVIAAIDYAWHARQAASADPVTVIVGHSGGGVVATDVAERLAASAGMSRLGAAFVAGMMMPIGMNFGELCGQADLAPPVGISAFVQPTTDGRGTVVPPTAGAAVFFQCAPPADALRAARRLVPQLESTRLIAPTWTPEGFGALPRLYVEATLDRSVPLAAQRTMQRLVPGAEVVTLETDHVLQLSTPADLVAALTEFAVSIKPRST